MNTSNTSQARGCAFVANRRNPYQTPQVDQAPLNRSIFDRSDTGHCEKCQPVHVAMMAKSWNHRKSGWGTYEPSPK